jgi:hypothetical protein
VLLQLRSPFVQPGAWVSRVSGRISRLDRATLKSFDGIGKGYNMGEKFNIWTLHFIFVQSSPANCLCSMFVHIVMWLGWDRWASAGEAKNGILC